MAITGPVVTLVVRRAGRARRRSRQLVDDSTALCWLAQLECRDARDLKHDARGLRVRQSAARLARV